jgi:hypothetical protein
MRIALRYGGLKTRAFVSRRLLGEAGMVSCAQLLCLAISLQISIHSLDAVTEASAKFAKSVSEPYKAHRQSLKCAAIDTLLSIWVSTIYE